MGKYCASTSARALRSRSTRYRARDLWILMALFEKILQRHGL